MKSLGRAAAFQFGLLKILLVMVEIHNLFNGSDHNQHGAFHHFTFSSKVRELFAKRLKPRVLERVFYRMYRTPLGGPEQVLERNQSEFSL